MKYEMADPKALEPSAYNPRKMSAEEMGKLRRSIREFGLVQPLIVQMPGNRIIAGHQRREAAIAEGLKRVPVHRLRISDAKARAMNLALNRISGEWDDEKLVLLLRELEAPERALSGFDEDEIARLLGDAIEGKGVEEQRLAPAPKVLWILLGIPEARAGEVESHLAVLRTAAEITVQASRNSATKGRKS
jgi:ParB-like chromosome segregation protein Spo0J